jgi:hypothetical protein
MTPLRFAPFVALALIACSSSSSDGPIAHPNAGGGAAGEPGSAGQAGASVGESAQSGAGGEAGAVAALPARPGRWYQGCGQPMPEHVVEAENAGAGGESPVTVPATNGCTAGLECLVGVCTFACDGNVNLSVARCNALGGTCEGFATGPIICVPTK